MVQGQIGGLRIKEEIILLEFCGFQVKSIGACDFRIVK